MGSLIWTLIIGFIVGLLARALKPGDDKLGIVMTTLLGVAGAFWHLSSAAAWAGTPMARRRVSSQPLWVPSRCYSCTD